MDQIKDVMDQVVEGSSLKRAYGKEVTWNLPTDQSPKFAGNFASLYSLV